MNEPLDFENIATDSPFEDTSDPGANPEAPVLDKSPAANFVSWEDEQPLSSAMGSRLGRRSLVKKKNVLRGEEVEITPKAPKETGPVKAIVTPIQLDGEVIGLRVKCGCGAVHEINFELPDQ